MSRYSEGLTNVLKGQVWIPLLQVRERETKREIEGGRERCGRREILENYISAARSKKDEIVFKRKLG